MSAYCHSPSLIALAVALALVIVNSPYCDSQLVSLSDLKNILVDCPSKRFSCEEEANNEKFNDRNCECDSDCSRYGDCCIDGSPSRNRPSRGQPVYKCVRIGKSRRPRGVYSISKCRSNWNGPQLIRQKCESSQLDISDPLLATPLTDRSRSRTYRNMHCAGCNGVDISTLVPWEVVVNCDLKTSERVTEEYIQNNLMYSEASNEWGINYRNSTRSQTFHPCKLEFAVPQELRNSVRLCRPDVISNCARGFTLRSVREKCEADYLAVVYAGYNTYKNPHCAMCNNVDVSNTNCLQTELASTSSTTMSLTLLFDVNRKDGNCVGRTDNNCRCRENQKWDSFFKRCRDIVCALPGYSIRDGECKGPSG